MTGAKIFVAAAYVVLGASFVASTALLIHEFQNTDWFSLVVAHSHLFFFFPVVSLLVLAAFYLPSVVFTHLYWNHLPYGKVRFLIGLLVVAGLSWGVARWLDASPRAIWEVSPRALAADRGEPAGCSNARGACQRAPIMEALQSLRDAGQVRVGLSRFARNCNPDPLLEAPEDMLKERYCFASKSYLQGRACCEAQARFRAAVDRLQADPAQRSLSGRFDMVFLPLKIFFVLILVLIGILLSVWRNKLDQHYSDRLPAVERGVIIGALAMLLWPAMDYGYQQTANALFGRLQGGPQFRLSLVIAPWALLLLFYFLRRLGKQGEMIGQIAGVVTAGVALLRYEDLNDWAVRLFGVGTNHYIVGALTALVVIGLIALIVPLRAGRQSGELSRAGS